MNFYFAIFFKQTKVQIYLGLKQSVIYYLTIHFQFSDEYIPTKYSTDHKEIEVRSRKCKVEILDTAGLSQYWGMRDNMIRQGDLTFV